MSESEELNKKLMATHSNINPIIRGPLSDLSQCEQTKHFVPTWTVTVPCSITCQVLWVHHGSPQSRQALMALGPRILLDLISMRTMLEGFPSNAQSSAEQQNLNLQTTSCPAFKYTPVIHTHTYSTPRFSMSHKYKRAQMVRKSTQLGTFMPQNVND